MPTYQYITDDGRVIEAHRPMREAGPIGGVEKIHDPESGKIVAATKLPPQHLEAGSDNWKPYISNRLPRHLAGVPCTPSGKPIVTSRKQERNIMARHGYERE
jgi:hypothetical protein